MATIRVGTVIESDFGTGPVVAITKEFVIHETEGGKEYAIYRPIGDYSIPVTDHEIGGGQELTIEHDDSQPTT